MSPVIRKARSIRGHRLNLRDAETRDAAFIVQLRTDPLKQRYISPTSPEIAQQVAWLKQYAEKTDDAYFVAENAAGEALGTIRLYEPRSDSFCFGSWVMKAGAPASSAVEALLMVYHYALDVLGFDRSYFAVRKANRSVWRFMEHFGGVRTHETDIDYCYETQRAPVLASLRRYAHILPGGIEVQA